MTNVIKEEDRRLFTITLELTEDDRYIISSPTQGTFITELGSMSQSVFADWVKTLKERLVAVRTERENAPENRERETLRAIGMSEIDIERRIGDILRLLNALSPHIGGGNHAIENSVPGLTFEEVAELCRDSDPGSWSLMSDHQIDGVVRGYRLACKQAFTRKTGPQSVGKINL